MKDVNIFSAVPDVGKILMVWQMVDEEGFTAWQRKMRRFEDCARISEHIY